MSGAKTQRGRVIFSGSAVGSALKSDEALSFYGGFDLSTGVVTEKGHPLEGVSVAGKILLFPTGKGSTVGSYALLRLAKEGVAPVALVMKTCDTTIAVGAIIAEIPCIDLIDIDQFCSGETLHINGEEVRRG